MCDCKLTSYPDITWFSCLDTFWIGASSGKTKVHSLL
jgi:hypothetical protein